MQNYIFSAKTMTKWQKNYKNPHLLVMGGVGERNRRNQNNGNNRRTRSALKNLRTQRTLKNLNILKTLGALKTPNLLLLVRFLRLKHDFPKYYG